MDGLGWLTARPIAHRGLHNAARGIVENTGSAVTAAIEAGYGVEVDLRPSSDNGIVVFHDATLDRLTEAQGPVSAHSVAGLKQVAFKNTDARMLSLQDLLELVAGRVPLLLEVKTYWDGSEQIEQRITAILQHYKGPVAVMSFDPRSLAHFAKYAPALPRGIVAERFRQADQWSQLSSWQRFVMRHMLHFRTSRPHFVAYDIHGLPSAAPLIARYALGLPLLTWTVRSGADRRKARLLADTMVFEGFTP